MIGVASIFLLLEQLFSIVPMIYGGYFFELLKFMKRGLGNGYLIAIILKLLSLSLAVMNLKRTIRTNLKYQFGILLLFGILAMVEFSNFKFSTTTLMPGWHTTIQSYSLFEFIFVFIIGVILNLLIVNFKLLPEFKDDIFN